MNLIKKKKTYVRIVSLYKVHLYINIDKYLNSIYVDLYLLNVISELKQIRLYFRYVKY